MRSMPDGTNTSVFVAFTLWRGLFRSTPEARTSFVQVRRAGWRSTGIDPRVALSE